jgi:hypothetical protein
MKLEHKKEQVELKPVVTQEEQFNLTLNRVEAEVLLAVTSLIGGRPASQVRQLTDKIWKGLSEHIRCTSMSQKYGLSGTLNAS